MMEFIGHAFVVRNKLRDKTLLKLIDEAIVDVAPLSSLLEQLGISLFDQPNIGCQESLYVL